MKTPAPSLLTLATVAALLQACGESAPNALFVGSDSDASVDESPDAGSGSGEVECTEDDEETCACSDREYGIRNCSDGHWGDCEACQPADTNEPLCVAGTYTAQMNGMYKSAASSFWGLDMGVDNPVNLSLDFELLREGDGEFYRVKGGCAPFPGEEKWDGEPDSSYDHTFQMSGTVDCNTGVIDFVLRLSFISKTASSLGGWARIFAEGKMTGRYDPTTKSIVTGKWNLREPRQVFDTVDPGGMGTFMAKLEEVAQGSADDDCFSFEWPTTLAPQMVPAPTQ